MNNLSWSYQVAKIKLIKVELSKLLCINCYKQSKETRKQENKETRKQGSKGARKQESKKARKQERIKASKKTCYYILAI